MRWRAIKRLADYFFGCDVRNFRDAVDDRDWLIVWGAIVANAMLIVMCFCIWLSVLALSIQLLYQLGWMP